MERWQVDRRTFWGAWAGMLARDWVFLAAGTLCIAGAALAARRSSDVIQHLFSSGELPP